MTNAIENIKIAREIISRDLLKGSDDYKTGVQACDDALNELEPISLEPFEPQEQTRIHLNDNEDTVWVLLPNGTHGPLVDLLRTDVLTDENRQAINDELADIINDRNFMQFMEQFNNESQLGDDI